MPVPIRPIDLPTLPGRQSAAVLAILEEAGVVGSVNGVLAILTAEALDNGGMGRPGAAGLAKSLRESLAAALADAPSGRGDVLDDIYGTVTPIRPVP
jgi:hypothetical protein